MGHRASGPKICSKLDVAGWVLIGKNNNKVVKVKILCYYDTSFLVKLLVGKFTN